MFTYEKITGFATNRGLEFKFDPFFQSGMGRMSRCSSRAKRTKPALCKRRGLTASPPWFHIEHEERVDKIMVSTRLKNISQIGYFPLIWG